MSFDRAALADAVARHGAVIRIVVAEASGSAPREPGAAMIVWAGGQSGTIGGGTLEFEAAARARLQLQGGAPARVERLALGPALGQCCGGSVVLVSERIDAARLAALAPVAGVVARPVAPGAEATPPLAVARILGAARATGTPPRPGLVDGWMVEPDAAPRRPVWIWGAGHVGRALVDVLSPLPGLAIRWADTGPERFPAEIPAGVMQLIAENPADLVPLAPPGAEHLVLTFSHALDLELCHRILGHGFAGLGLIGSATKKARFHSRLRALGHADAQILRIACPIGDPALGKHPHAIAVGVAAALLLGQSATRTAKDRAG